MNNRGVNDQTAAGAAVALEMQLVDFAFDPTFVKVAPGANVRLTVRNAAPLADHTFTMDSLAIHRQLKPGEQAELVIQLPTSGAFRFYCRLHADRGMQGAFYFTEGEAPVTSAMTPPPTGSPARSRPAIRRPAATSTGSAPQPTPEDDVEDLEIPDLDVDGADDDGQTARSSKGAPGQDGAQGAPGAPGEQGEEIIVP